MNGYAGGNRGPRRAAALAAVAAAMLTACGASPPSTGGPAPAGPAAYRAELAYAHCKQTHGAPNFPTPASSSQRFHISGHLNGNSPAARANDACQHLLPPGSTGTGSATAPAPASTAGAAAADCPGSLPCYTPRQFRVAYGIQPLLDRGIDGRGVTVALPEQAESGPVRPRPVSGLLQSVTDIRKDLAGFDSRFGLPPARIQVITTLAGSSASPWLASVEEVEDTELVHTVAPGAIIREILVDHFNLGEGSWASAEVATMNSALQYAAARHVTVVVASGDEGAIGNGSTTPVKEVILPTSDPLVLAAGGTSLTANPVTGAYISETAWSDPGNQPSASGGGFSRLFARPAYQDGVPGIGATRGVPDVAADASGTTGMALAFSAPGGSYELIGAGGTSAAAPFWAGLIALADQEAGHPLGFVNPAIYRIARGPLYHKAFHDITTGKSTVLLNGVTVTGYQAGPGWDRSPAGAPPTPRSSSPCSPAEAPRNVPGFRGHRTGNGAPPWTVTFPGKDLAAARQTGTESRQARLPLRGARRRRPAAQHSQN
jgi:subtilase family serine protease